MKTGDNMKRVNWSRAAGMLLVLILISGCEVPGLPDQGTDDDGPLSADITSATILEKGVYTLKNSVYVEAELTIPPGTSLRFGDGVWLDVTTSGGLGKITALGTAEEPIIFTSSRSTTSAGDWQGIFVHNNGSRFEYCEFRYADTALTVSGNSVSVSHCTFASNMTGVRAHETTSGFVLSGNAFTANKDPLLFNASFDLDNSNTFSGNINQRIEFNGADITTARTWEETEVPIFAASSFYVEAPLTLTPGLTLAMGSDVWIDVTENTTGAILAIGTDTAAITFTSITSTPVAGDWQGIYLNKNGCQFQYCVFEYADTALTTNSYTWEDLGNNIFRYNNFDTD